MGAPGTTKGPWVYRACKPDDGVGYIEAIDRDGDRDIIHAGVEFLSRAENMANNHQIAASGALYDALVAELADIEEDIQWAAACDLAPLIKRRDRAELALALARGEHPTPPHTQPKGRSDGDRG